MVRGESRVPGQNMRDELLTKPDVVVAHRVKRLLDQPFDSEQGRAEGPRPAVEPVRIRLTPQVLPIDHPGHVAGTVQAVGTETILGQFTDLLPWHPDMLRIIGRVKNVDLPTVREPVRLHLVTLK
jgi:hypothetical protein